MKKLSAKAINMLNEARSIYDPDSPERLVYNIPRRTRGALPIHTEVSK